MKILNKKTTNNTLNTLRVLSVEAIAKANSGHPGIALGSAPIMYALFKDHINIDVKNTSYFNRDRLVMSAGHGSSLLYTTMILAGYNSISLKVPPAFPYKFPIDHLYLIIVPLDHLQSLYMLKRFVLKYFGD